MAALAITAIPTAKATAAEPWARAVTTATYVNENGTDPAPLNLRELQGTVVGLGGEAMPRAQVTLFTEADHSPVATVTSDREGKFRFDKVEKGFYRVLARVEGLCPANVPVKLESSLFAKRKLIITMRPKGLDTCSYGVAK
ncbi:MAG TPA: carboxypeptidase-like regulatory domain-containing protein [Acidobacteriaceae bacterium]